MATLTLIQFSPRPGFFQTAFIIAETFLIFTRQEREKRNKRLQSGTEKHEKCYNDTAVSQEMGGCSVTLCPPPPVLFFLIE